jgi:trehalose utilization protein
VYFSPGDQEFPVYHQPEIQRVIANSVRWCGHAADPVDLPSKREGNSQRNWYLKPG